jgi:hypothetical protein
MQRDSSQRTEMNQAADVPVQDGACAMASIPPAAATTVFSTTRGAVRPDASPPMRVGLSPTESCLRVERMAHRAGRDEARADMSLTPDRDQLMDGVYHLREQLSSQTLAELESSWYRA